MGVIEPMVIGGALSTGMLSLVAPPELWGALLATLATAAVGIMLAIPRSRRPSPTLRLIRPVAAH